MTESNFSRVLSEIIKELPARTPQALADKEAFLALTNVQEKLRFIVEVCKREDLPIDEMESLLRGIKDLPYLLVKVCIVVVVYLVPQPDPNESPFKRMLVFHKKLPIALPPGEGH